MSIDYNDLYGISLKEYIKHHGTSLEDVMEKVKKDIQLLNINLKEVIEKDGITDSKVTVIHSTIRKKQKHLNKLQEWGKENEEI